MATTNIVALCTIILYSVHCNVIVCTVYSALSFNFVFMTRPYLAIVTFTRANVRQCHEMYIF
jgi:hypothetical protein